VIVYHVAIRCADDYVTRREPLRHAHLERLQGFRAAGAVIGGGPAPDGKTADIFYRLQQPAQLKLVVEEDPYWTGGAWTGYEARSFSEFVEPWELPPLVLDGSRRVTIVEGRTRDREMAQFALVELRGTGRLVFGGLFDTGDVLALLRTTDPAEATGWLEATGFWAPGTLTARPYIYVL
jgi:uncharacterized protein YciI